MEVDPESCRRAALMASAASGDAPTARARASVAAFLCRWRTAQCCVADSFGETGTQFTASTGGVSIGAIGHQDEVRRNAFGVHGLPIIHQCRALSFRR